MKIFVKVKSGSKENKITPPPLKLLKTEEEKEYFVVSVKERPVQGMANKAVAKLLAEYFGVPRTKIILVKGEKSKTKTYQID